MATRSFLEVISHNLLPERHFILSLLTGHFSLERVTEIESVTIPWEGIGIPFTYTRRFISQVVSWLNLPFHLGKVAYYRCTNPAYASLRRASPLPAK